MTEVIADIPGDPPNPVEKPEIFREVPNFDERTLVLKLGEKLLDLQFCACPNKYKKRFSAFLKENTDLIEDIRQSALNLAAGGYEVDVREILSSLRFGAKLNTPASDYLRLYPHDFELDSLPRAYLVRKLMMEEPKLFGKFELSPVKCRSNCGYPSDPEPEEEETATDLAGF